MTKIDEAYSALNSLIEKAQKIAESVEDEFQYNPFDYLDSPLRRERAERIRPRLIEYYAKKCQVEYTPNYEPAEKFMDMMDEAVGRDGFDSSVIRNYFVNLAGDRDKLHELSWNQTKERAAHLRAGSYYNRPTIDEIVQDRVLLLRAATWHKANVKDGGYVSYYSLKNYHAMQSLIDVVTLKASPVEKSESTFLTEHLDKKLEPQTFYGKHKVQHPTVEAFQFYKNDKLKIWFKKPRYAKAVAEEIVKVSFA